MGLTTETSRNLWRTMQKNDLIPIVTQEECAEVIQAISKVFRFGMQQSHPVTGVTNKEQLEEEVGQLLYMLHTLEIYFNLDTKAISKAYNQKQSSLDKYEQYFPF